MEADRPGPGEELNDGPVVDARPAASAIVLRDVADGLEVLLLQRNPESRFMGGAWVFPGGSVNGDDEADGVPGPVEIVERTFLGHDVLYRVRLADGTDLWSQRPSNEQVPLGARVNVCVYDGPVVVFPS